MHLHRPAYLGRGSVDQKLANEAGQSSRHPNPFKRIGFFHFRDKFDDPLGELESALDKHSPDELNEALIVLPEAFNLIGAYHQAPLDQAMDYEEFRTRLRRLCSPAPLSNGEVPSKTSALRKITFIVGILDKATRRNSAYCVSEEKDVLLCHKMGPDAPRYFDPHPVRGADNENPHDGVAALICLDAMDTPEVDWEENRIRRERRSRVLSRDPWLVCSPQRNYYREGNNIADATGRWRIIANGRENPECPSMIIDPSDLVLHDVAMQNQVGLVELPPREGEAVRPD